MIELWSILFFEAKLLILFNNQVLEILEPQGRYPCILNDGHVLLTAKDQNFLHAVGFGARRNMGRIHQDYPLLAALLERWDSSTGTFHLPTREMNVMVEDIHHLYRLPIQGQWIQHALDQDSVHPDIAIVYRVGVVEGVMGEMFSRGLP